MFPLNFPLVVARTPLALLLIRFSTTKTFWSFKALLHALFYRTFPLLLMSLWRRKLRGVLHFGRSLPIRMKRRTISLFTFPCQRLAGLSVTGIMTPSWPGSALAPCVRTALSYLVIIDSGASAAKGRI
jgi:hypothetical protein